MLAIVYIFKMVFDKEDIENIENKEEVKTTKFWKELLSNPNLFSVFNLDELILKNEESIIKNEEEMKRKIDYNTNTDNLNKDELSKIDFKDNNLEASIFKINDLNDYNN